MHFWSYTSTFVSYLTAQFKYKIEYDFHYLRHFDPHNTLLELLSAEVQNGKTRFTN